ncbi:hypothetical protein GBAR_LOCUS29770 [Geodia barretti]|uniref:Uncharacterized protein n=1 Tax=Geodia barretti TaxID=519541 RepID=A0AA35TV96_GEOBA|nr:hypothetical protein GBAR_LOCUS29770 [Geodia barretti]
MEITGQKTDGTSIIITWDTFQPGTNPILILVTLGNGDLHYFSITVDADLIYTVCDVQISFLDADQRNIRFRIQASLQKNININGGTYNIHSTLGNFAEDLLLVPTALLKDGKNTIMISVSVTCGGFWVTLQKEAYLTVQQPDKLTELIYGPPSEPIEGDSFLVTISVKGDGVDFLMMVEAMGAQTITRWSCTLGKDEKKQPDSSPIRFNRGALEEGDNVILVVVTGSDGGTVTRDFIIYYLKYIPSTKICDAKCVTTPLSSGVKVVCSTSSDSIQSVQYSINDDGNQMEAQMSTFVITDKVAWRKGSNMLQLIVVCDNGAQGKQPTVEITLTPPDLQCQVMYSPCDIETEVTISCSSTTTAQSTKSCSLDDNQYTTQCGLINVLKYETLTLGSHTFTVDMTDVFGLKAKSEVAFSAKFEIWCTGACNFYTKLVSVSCESTYPASSWTVSINGGTAEDRSQNFDLDLKDEDLTQDLTLEMTAINTSGESAIDTIFLRGQLLL